MLIPVKKCRFWQLFPDFGDVFFLQISMTFFRFQQLIKSTDAHPHLKPTHPIDSGGQFRVPLPSTWHRQVKSGLSPKPTRPDPWTGLLTYTTMCSFESTDSSILNLLHTNTHVCDFEIYLKGFRSPSIVVLYATTSTTLDLEILQGILPIKDFRKLWVQKPQIYS